MEAKTQSYSFLSLLSLYLVLHFLQAKGTGPEWIRFYGKDIIIVPLLLLGVSKIQFVCKRKIEIHKKEIFLLVIYLILVFEIILPLTRPEITTDALDIVMYIVGALLYHHTFRDGTKQFLFEKTMILRKPHTHKNVSL